MLSAYDRDAERQRVLTRRALVLGGLQGLAVSALVGRLYYLQMVEGEKYTMLAEDNRISPRLLAPPRGLIVDRLGVPLALNEQNFRLMLVSERAVNVRDTLERLGRLVPLDETDMKRVLRDVQRARPFAPVTVRENLTWEQVAAIEVSLPELPGVSIDVGQVRSYPFGEATAHLLGYVGAVSERDLEKSDDPLLTLPGFRIGKEGVERLHDQALRGTAGSQQLEVNAFGRVIRELSRQEGQPGRQVALTIDAKLQHYVQQRLASEPSAAAIVMDIRTGGILAMVSQPAFDPNQFAMGISSTLWRQLQADETTPLINKTIAGEYAPGSTLKMLVGLAALESGAVGPDFQVYCPGHYRLGSHRFHCWKRGGHGTVDMRRAVQHSCDVYFYEVSRRVGVDRIADMCRRFGLGGRTGLDLPGERAGLIPDTRWKRAALKEPWYEGETLVVSIGQGYMLATPLQLAVMTARLVNGGHAIVPHLTKSVEDLYAERTEWPSLGIGPESLAFMRSAMDSVVNEPGGTAYNYARIRESGFEMGGKTGTSQVRRITMAERAAGLRKPEEIPWRHRDHGLFVGYAPIHAPRYAVCVLLEHGISGGRYASPVARDILMEIQLLDASRNVAAVPSPLAQPVVSGLTGGLP